VTWVVQLLRLALSKESNRIGVSFPSPEDGNRPSFRNVFLFIYNSERWTKSRNLVIQDNTGLTNVYFEFVIQAYACYLNAKRAHEHIDMGRTSCSDKARRILQNSCDEISRKQHLRRPIDTEGYDWRRIYGNISRRYQIFWEVVGLERGPFSLESTTELLERKSSGSGLESPEYGRRDTSCWPRDTLYPQKLALTSPTSGWNSSLADSGHGVIKAVRHHVMKT
jgi:hypothetical protein